MIMGESELVDFLLARIDEDEAVARAANDVAAAPWWWGHLPPPLKYGLVGRHPIHADATVVIVPSPSGDMWPDRYTADHIVRHDPARVLAECEAKRQVVSFADTMVQLDRHPEATRTSDAWAILRALSLPYADHADYRAEWKP